MEMLKPEYKLIGGFEWIFSYLLKSAAFSLQMSENYLKPPKNPFKRQIKVRQWFTTRGTFVHKAMLGHPKKFIVFFSCFLEILMVSDKKIHKAFRTHTTL